MVDKEKRYLFRSAFLKPIAGAVASFREGMAAAERKAAFERFFETDESCYALSLAYPEDLLLETARMHGIQTDGLEKKEIVKALFSLKGQDDYRF
jgi:hypothetical protein